MINYCIAKSYTDTPGPRHIIEGEFSGEHFRENVLLSLLEQAKDKREKVRIDLDGGYGYPTSFLEEAFGGLVRVTKEKQLLNWFEFKSDEEPALIEEINLYIKKATGAIK